MASEHDIAAFQKGDWAAGDRLVQTFGSLLTSLAKERSTDPAVINKYIDAGKEGVLLAARKFKLSDSHARFQLFALDFIEECMDKVNKPKGFLARLFGGG
jgi:hypothetical protein